MGFSLSGIAKDLGLSLPKIDFKQIGSDVLGELKDVAGQVVKDEFQLSNQPDKVMSEDLNLNILGNNVTIPNPLNALANKLLGKADDFTNKYGVNIDFKKLLGNVFNLKTEGGTVAVPPATTRIQDGTLAIAAASTPATAATVAQSFDLAADGANAVGGGAAVASNTAVADSGADAVGGASTTSVTSGSNGILDAAGKASDAQASLLSQIEGLDPESSDYQKQLLVMQTKMQAAAQAFQMLSQIMEMMHETSKNTIANIR